MTRSHSAAVIDTPTAQTRLIALLGNPVGHSISPRVQNAAFQHAGVDGVYLALRCDTQDVPGLLRGIAWAGGGGNVTVPHKLVAAGAVDRGTEAVVRTGACNTYWREGGEVCGDNTDVIGSARCIEAVLGRSAAGARVLLVGGGGGASAALAALSDQGAEEVVLLNRTEERARQLAARFADTSMKLHVITAESGLPDGTFDLAINATPLGLKAEDAPPLSEQSTARIGGAFDMTYRGGGTTWIRQVAEAGLPAVDGREMLLCKGVAAFERWWNVSAPVEAMRAALETTASAE